MKLTNESRQISANSPRVAAVITGLTPVLRYLKEDWQDYLQNDPQAPTSRSVHLRIMPETHRFINNGIRNKVMRALPARLETLLPKWDQEVGADWVMDATAMVHSPESTEIEVSYDVSAGW